MHNARISAETGEDVRKMTALEVAAQNLTKLHRSIVQKQTAVAEMKAAVDRADCELLSLLSEYSKQLEAFHQKSSSEFSEETTARLARETKFRATSVKQ